MLLRPLARLEPLGEAQPYQAPRGARGLPPNLHQTETWAKLRHSRACGSTHLLCAGATMVVQRDLGTEMPESLGWHGKLRLLGGQTRPETGLDSWRCPMSPECTRLCCCRWDD